MYYFKTVSFYLFYYINIYGHKKVERAKYEISCFCERGKSTA